MQNRKDYYLKIGFYQFHKHQLKQAIDKLSTDLKVIPFTKEQLDLLHALDERQLLPKVRPNPRPDSFPAQKQFSQEQRILTRKLQCLAVLLEKSPKNDSLIDLNMKLQSLLGTYIRHQQNKATLNLYFNSKNY